MYNIIQLTYETKKLYNHLCLPVIKKYQLTRCELDILLFIHNNPDYNTAKDIVEKRGIIKSQASSSLEQLINKGYITTSKDQDDKRKTRITLLDLSSPIIKDGLIAQKKFNEIIMKDFSEEERYTLESIMKHIYQNIKEEEL